MFHGRVCKLLCETNYSSLLRCGSVRDEVSCSVGHEGPASVWQLDEVRQMVLDTGASTWAVFECQFGGLAPKPTRFVSNIFDAKKVKYNKWPSISKSGQYLGPLPYSGHKWHVKKLIGKSKDGRFQTAPSPAYPARLCMFLAQLMASVLRKGGDELSQQQATSVDFQQQGPATSVDFQQQVSQQVPSMENQQQVPAVDPQKGCGDEDGVELTKEKDAVMGCWVQGWHLHRRMLANLFGLSGLVVSLNLWMALDFAHRAFTNRSNVVHFWAVRLSHYSEEPLFVGRTICLERNR